MFKWISWVIRLGATALLLSFLCIWTTGYIVNSYMESVIKQLDLPIQVQPIALSGVWGTLWGADKQPKKEAQAEASKPSSGANTPEPRQAQTNEDNRSGTPSDESPVQEGPDASSDEDVAVQPDAVSNASPEPDSDGVAIDDGTVPVFNEDAATGQLTDADRQRLYAMVVSKLSQEQLKLLSDALQGGLTPEELPQIESMLKASLSEEEYSQMMGVLRGSKTSEKEAVPE